MGAANASGRALIARSIGARTTAESQSWRLLLTYPCDTCGSTGGTETDPEGMGSLDRRNSDGTLGLLSGKNLLEGMGVVNKVEAMLIATPTTDAFTYCIKQRLKSLQIGSDSQRAPES